MEMPSSGGRPKSASAPLNTIAADPAAEIVEGFHSNLSMCLASRCVAMACSISFAVTAEVAVAAAGTTDGTTWTLLDERHNETSPWPHQTRPFQIPTPAPFTHYRLTTTPAILTQLELLH